MHACTQYFTFVFGVVCSSTFPLYVRLYKCRKYERKTIAHDIKAPNYDHWDLLYYTVLTMHVSISAVQSQAVCNRRSGFYFYLCWASGGTNKPVRTKVGALHYKRRYIPTNSSQSESDYFFTSTSQEHNSKKYLRSFYKSSMSGLFVFHWLALCSPVDHLVA